MKSNYIHLVMGISSAGKSIYIKSKQDSGEWKGIPLLMAYQIGTDFSAEILQQECIVHYNLFRPYNNDVVNVENDLFEDKALSLLLKYNDRIKVSLLVTRPAVLTKRILQRTEVEPILIKRGGYYPQQKIAELLCHLDMNQFHEKWINLLQEFQINFTILNSETDKYPIISADNLTTFFHVEQKSHIKDFS